MRVCIHRGTQQIGGSCIELAHEGVRILLDIGLPLDGEFGDSALMPAITEGVAAVVVSHPHVDHYGLLHHLPAGIPVYIGAAARRIIEAAAPFTGQPLPSLAGFDLQHRTPIQIGRFRSHRTWSIIRPTMPTDYWSKRVASACSTAGIFVGTDARGDCSRLSCSTHHRISMCC